MTTLGEITSKDGNRTEIQELESISRVVQEGKSKANDIRGQLKTLEATSNRMTSQYNKAQNEINDTFLKSIFADVYLLGTSGFRL